MGMEELSTGGRGLHSDVDWFFRVLLHADNLVLLSHDPAELRLMLHVLHEMCSKFGLVINAYNLTLMSMCPVVAGPDVEVGW